jgi:hypothetical protein
LCNDYKFYELQYDSQSDKFYYEIEVGQWYFMTLKLLSMIG